jgi:hypothetical protein
VEEGVHVNGCEEIDWAARVRVEACTRYPGSPLPNGRAVGHVHRHHPLGERTGDRVPLVQEAERSVAARREAQVRCKNRSRPSFHASLERRATEVVDHPLQCGVGVRTNSWQ